MGQTAVIDHGSATIGPNAVTQLVAALKLTS